MVRNVLGVVAGIVAAFAVVMGWEILTHLISPPPRELNWRDAAVVADYMRALPAWKFAVIVLGYGLASFAGAWVSRWIARRDAWFTWIPAAVLIVGVFLNVSQMPHPIWFPAASILITLAGAWLNDRLADKGQPSA